MVSEKNMSYNFQKCKFFLNQFQQITLLDMFAYFF